MDFSTLYSIEDFRDLADAYSDKIGNDARADSYDNLKEQVLHKALTAYMKHLIKAEKIKPITHLPNADCHFITSWNAMITKAKSSSWEWAEVIRSITHQTIFTPIYKVDKPTSYDGSDKLTREERITQGYATFITSINEGIIGDRWRAIEGYDRKSGRRINIRFEGWVPEITYLDLKTANHCIFEDPQPVAMETVDLWFPTGELVCFDWFRVEAFTSIVGAAEIDHDHDINSIDGQIGYTKAFAKTFNMVHVNAGNSSPSVLVNHEGVITVGHTFDRYGNDIKRFGKFKKVGDICCDLWWASIIDKQDLLKIMSEELGKEGAQKAFDDYIKKQSFVVQFKVEPGDYRLTFAGTQDFFCDHVDRKKYGMVKKFEPMFTLERLI